MIREIRQKLALSVIHLPCNNVTLQYVGLMMRFYRRGSFKITDNFIYLFNITHKGPEGHVIQQRVSV